MQNKRTRHVVPDAGILPPEVQEEGHGAETMNTDPDELTMLRKMLHLFIVLTLAVLPLAPGGVSACVQASGMVSMRTVHEAGGAGVSGSSHCDISSCPTCGEFGFKVNCPASTPCMQGCANLPTSGITSSLHLWQASHDAAVFPEHAISAARLVLQPPVPPPKSIPL